MSTLDFPSAPASIAASHPAECLAALDRARLRAGLDANGHALIPGLLDADRCAGLIRQYADAHAFRSRIVMARHNFGRGEYQYFAYPLPAEVQALRSAAYALLAPVANAWNERLDIPQRYPAAHADYLARCHEAGQLRPTPLLLKYGAGDFNCLHQDLYGAEVFPLQLAVLLSQPGEDFDGGEFVLTEQRPRQQSRVDVVPLRRGDAVVFAVSQRPVPGTRGVFRANLRHGVSRLRSGQRFTLGVIFHDAT